MDQFSVDDIPLDELVTRLSRGQVMVYPTETVAGIGSIGSSKEVVERVFAAKKRPKDKPVSYAFDSWTMAERYVTIEPQFQPLLQLLPGPLTVVAPLCGTHPPIYGISDHSLGVRIPDVGWMRSLVGELDEPVITTSANISGLPTARSVAELDQELLDQVDFLLTWDQRLDSPPSTVVSVVDDLRILREGAISSKTVHDLLR